MAYGKHWEWRGFGGVSSRFVKTFCKLSTHLSFHEVDDQYLSVPGLSVNAKFREGAENGLKFKRMEQREGNFEVWDENEKELFEFPLSHEAWTTLREVLSSVDISLPDYPSDKPGLSATQNILFHTGCSIINVTKQRESRLWEGKSGKVLVEWACIAKPQSCISVGLENWEEDTDENLTDQKAKEVVRSAVEVMGLDREPLQAMNYMDAVKVWASGNKI